MSKLLFSIFIAILLIGCGGNVTAKPANICLQPSNGPVNMSNCDGSIFPTHGEDPVVNLAKQASIPGNMILWVGHKFYWELTVNNFVATVDESKKYGNKFNWVYLYDEISWCETSFCEFTHEDTVLAGAAYAHSKGIKNIVTIMPDVVLDPRFKLKSINSYDAIGIDVYPSARPGNPDLGNCRFSSNYLENLFYCSGQKLRSMGYTGALVYIFQGFGMKTDTHNVRMNYLQTQRQAINNASAMGASAVISFGCYIGPDLTAIDTNLVPLCGTIYEPWVTP